MSYISNNSLKGYILGYVRSKYPDFVHKGEITKKAAVEWGFMTENAGRRCRELVREGKFEYTYEKAKSGARCVLYKWIPPEEPKGEIPEEVRSSLVAQGVLSPNFI